MLAQNGTSHSFATKILETPTKDKNPTKAQTLETVTIPALQEKLKEAIKELKELKKLTLS